MCLGLILDTHLLTSKTEENNFYSNDQKLL